MSVCEVKTVTCVTETYLGSTLQILPPCMENNSNSKQMITSESLWGIKLQIFRFLTTLLYHRATETLWWAKPNMKLIYTARISNVISIMFCKYVWFLMGTQKLTIFLILYTKHDVESEGLRIDSSWGLGIFSLSHTCDKMEKHLFPLATCSNNLTIYLSSQK